MTTKLKEIHDYLISCGAKESELREMDHHSIHLAKEIMLFAHQNQKRVNGERYESHPLQCLKSYQEMLCMDSHVQLKELLDKYGIPFEGVQELCLLHDVVEDSELSFQDVEDIFKECGFEAYFERYISKPLKNITHDKKQCYEDYIQICIEHPTSALVKMLDMQDNMDVFSLTAFGEENYKRTNQYLHFMYLINQKFHFIENAEKYRRKTNE